MSFVRPYCSVTKFSRMDKYCILLLFAIITINVEGCLRQQIDAYIVQCLEGMRGNKGDIYRNFQNGVVDSNVACLMHCVFVKMQIVTRDGNINIRGIKVFQIEAQSDCRYQNDCKYVEDSRKIEQCLRTVKWSDSTCGLSGEIAVCMFKNSNSNNNNCKNCNNNNQQQPYNNNNQQQPYNNNNQQQPYNNNNQQQPYNNNNQQQPNYNNNQQQPYNNNNQQQPYNNNNQQPCEKCNKCNCN